MHAISLSFITDSIGYILSVLYSRFLKFTFQPFIAPHYVISLTSDCPNDKCSLCMCKIYNTLVMYSANSGYH